jgi:hypothetical protein
MRRVRVLRFVYLLALIVWVGGLVALGTVVGPTLSSLLRARFPSDGQAVAGATFGAILGQFHVVAAICGGVMLVALVAMALLGPRPRPFSARVVVLALMLVATGLTGLAGTATPPSTALLSATLAGGVCLLFWETS